MVDGRPEAGDPPFQLYRQYRFAGRNAFYRVWSDNDVTDLWHHGEGGGIYYAPAQLAVIWLIAGHSTEGWFPYISLGVRF
jgi:hypothetical protein